MNGTFPRSVLAKRVGNLIWINSLLWICKHHSWYLYCLLFRKPYLIVTLTLLGFISVSHKYSWQVIASKIIFTYTRSEKVKGIIALLRWISELIWCGAMLPLQNLLLFVQEEQCRTVCKNAWKPSSGGVINLYISFFLQEIFSKPHFGDRHFWRKFIKF